MALTLYAHPFSSYSWKVLIPLYENATPFSFKSVDTPEDWAELEALWPIKLMPVLRDGDRTIMESTIVIEYLDLVYPGPARMIPADAKAALQVRFLDRVFDNYVMTPANRVVFDFIRPENDRDPSGVAKAKESLERTYAWLDTTLPQDSWAAGANFSLADCAAAPSLFYADWVHPIDAKYKNLTAYRARLLARPSVARCVDDARPFRHFFPPGAPDRD